MTPHLCNNPFPHRYKSVDMSCVVLIPVNNSSVLIPGLAKESSPDNSKGSSGRLTGILEDISDIKIHFIPKNKPYVMLSVN